MNVIIVIFIFYSQIKFQFDFDLFTSLIWIEFDVISEYGCLE